MRWFVGADGAKWVQSGDRAPGRHVPMASHVPIGDSHAVPVDGDRALCGRPVHELAVFEWLNFETVRYLRRCGQCHLGVLDAGGVPLR